MSDLKWNKNRDICLKKKKRCQRVEMVVLGFCWILLGQIGGEMVLNGHTGGPQMKGFIIICNPHREPLKAPWHLCQVEFSILKILSCQRSENYLNNHDCYSLRVSPHPQIIVMINMSYICAPLDWTKQYLLGHLPFKNRC